MKRLIVGAVLACTALAGAAAPALAQGVNAKQYNQERRIEQGERSGALAPGEASRLQRQQNNIARQEHRMRSHNGGYLTRRQRYMLRQKQARANHRIYRLKHNGRTY